MSPGTFWTIGHSNHALDAFVALLSANGIDAVADVRRYPRSRSNPQFNIETLPAALAACGMIYEHLEELGGRRAAQKNRGSSPNGFWEHASFRNYADYAETPAFRSGFAALLQFGASRNCCVMCSEALWWRCHRRIIADYLLAGGHRVLHIAAAGKVEDAKLTASAVPTAQGTLVYPAPV